MDILYVTISYVILFFCFGIWMVKRLNNSSYYFIKNSDFFIFMSAKKYRHLFLILCVVMLVFGVFFERVYGIFGEPSALTLGLSGSYVIQYIFNKNICISKKALSWFGLMAFFIVLMALGVFSKLGIDFYHRYFDDLSLAIHYLFFMIIFAVALVLDKKNFWLAWFVLLAFTFSIMNSHIILDYVADVWLFLFGFMVVVKYSFYGIKQLFALAMLKIKNKKAIT